MNPIDQKKHMKETAGINQKLPEKESDLLKEIVLHETYSAMYKLKLAQVVLFKASIVTAKVTLATAKYIKKKIEGHTAKRTNDKKQDR